MSQRNSDMQAAAMVVEGKMRRGVVLKLIPVFVYMSILDMHESDS